jgi:hypothetical protein
LKKLKKTGPKILFLDIETAPILGYVWDIWEQNIPLNMIKQDWSILAWAAKWAGDAPNKIMYMDQRNAKNIEDDSKILKVIWELMDQSDIIVTQNGRAFDEKKLNARFILNGMKPPSAFKHIDTKLIASRKFKFTSNKLEYMTEKLNKKYKKLKHEKFSGFSLWKECLAGNKLAWKEMEKYNKYDVLSLEELYETLIPWDSSINFSVYYDDDKMTCSCGSTKFMKNGYRYTTSGKFQRYRCMECGSDHKSGINLFNKEKKESLRK